MKWFAILLLAVQVYAQPIDTYQSVVRVASATGIPNNFTDSTATFINGLSRKRRNICVTNDTSTNIEVCFSYASASDCPTDSTNTLWVPNGGGECRDQVFVAGSVFVKGASAISSGNVAVGVW